MTYRRSTTNGGHTGIVAEADFEFADSLAQFAKNAVVNDVARPLTGEFAKNFEAKFAAPASTARKLVSEPAATDLRAGRLVVSVPCERLKALLRRLLARG